MLIAARSADGYGYMIHLWNLATRLPVALFQAHTHRVTSLVVLDDGQAFLSADVQGDVYRWVVPAEIRTSNREPTGTSLPES
jgi:WD40 repeat protein